VYFQKDQCYSAFSSKKPPTSAIVQQRRDSTHIVNKDKTPKPQQIRFENKGSMSKARFLLAPNRRGIPSNDVTPSD